MRHYKKKTIALCIASMLTVLGAFSADNYKNSLVTLKIDKGSGGQVSLTAYTRKPLNIPISVEKTGDETYSIFIPETYSEMSAMPNITGYDNIDSLVVSTYPYTPNSQGYTAIHIKTKGNPFLSTNSAVYIEGSSGTPPMITDINISQPQMPIPAKTQEKQTSYWDKLENNQKKQSNANKTTNQPNYEKYETQKPETTKYNNNNNNSEEVTVNYVPEPEHDNTNERLAVTFGFMFLVLIIFFIYFIGKDKMKAVIGEHSNYSFDEDNNKKRTKQDKINKISNKINNLDKKYSNNYSLRRDVSETSEEQKMPKEETVIVDLDSLYKAKSQKEAEENTEQDDLESFLFSLYADKDTTETNEILYDDLLYQDIINNTHIQFTQKDIDKLESLIQNEISESTIEKLSEYMSQADVKPHKKTNAQALEDLLAEYTIKQNILFSKDDVDAIKKLMNIELDNSFITDLRTNKARTKTMEQELKKRSNTVIKPNPELILNVKHMLPNLSEELKKQGNRPIEPNSKHEVIYYNDEYDVSILSVSSELAALTKNISSSADNTYRPSDEIATAANGYDVMTLSIKDEYPDLADVKSSIKKYETVNKKEYVGEDQLIKNLANISFKPFYEENVSQNNSFDKITDIATETETETETKTETKTEIETETKTKTTDKTEPNNIQIKQDTENINNHTQKEPVITQEIVKNNITDIIERRVVPSNMKVNKEAEELLKLIEEQQLERQNKQQLQISNKETIRALSKKSEIKSPDDINSIPALEYKSGDINYKAVKSAKCNDSTCCILAKYNNEYIVLGKINDKIIELKKYENLKSEIIQVRLNEKLSDGIYQYIVRIGVHKFIIQIKNDNMEFIMDLC